MCPTRTPYTTLQRRAPSKNRPYAMSARMTSRAPGAELGGRIEVEDVVAAAAAVPVGFLTLYKKGASLT